MRKPLTVLNDTDIAGAETIYSEPWSCACTGAGLTVFTGGGIAGTWTLWVTDKPEPDRDSDTDWVDLSAHASFVETNPTGGVKASLDLDGVGLSTNCDTIVEAANGGTAGNSLTIEFVDDGTGVGTLDENADGTYVFHFENNVTTVANFETAVAASDNLDVKTTGTGANVLTTAGDVFGPDALAGGTDVTTKWHVNLDAVYARFARLKLVVASGYGSAEVYVTQVD